MFNLPIFNSSRKETPTERDDGEFVVRESRDVMAVVPKNGVRRAILVATGRHLKRNIPSLPGVDPDVDLIYERLVDPRCGFKDENVVVLKTDDYPTRERIEEEVKKFLDSCKSDDLIFLYFSGHGFHDVKKEPGGAEVHTDYYVPFDAEPIVEKRGTVSFVGSTCFSLSCLREQIGACRAKFKWVVVDACRVNQAAKTVGEVCGWDRIGQLEAAKGSLWFQSCGIDQESYEISVVEGKNSVNHGLFTWCFCEGARGGAANRDGLVSPLGIFNFAREKMKEEHTKNPVKVPKQTPLLSCQELSDAEFVFVDISEADTIRAKKAYDAACNFLINGDYEQAQTSVRKALDVDPQNEKYQDLNARVEELLKDEQIKAIDKQAQACVAQGWKYFNEGKYSEALDEANKALEIAPTNDGASALKKQAENPIPTGGKNREENASTEPRTEDKTSDARLENGKVYYAASGRRAKAGRDAFAKTDYFLAKEEAENALKFNPTNAGAQDLLKKAQDELDKLARLIEEGNALFDSAKYEEALKKAREAKALSCNYPDADALESKAKPPIVSALVVAGWEAYSFNDDRTALAKAKEAYALNPNNEEVGELLKELGGFFVLNEPGARTTLEYKGVEFAFRYCPAGTFTMGSPSYESGRDDDETQREVTLDDSFLICEVPTTQAQWNVVGCNKVKECGFKGDKLPVENVTWYECDAFVKKLNELGVAPEGWRFALPTEEQWEYACRAGTTGATYGAPLDKCAWYCQNSGSTTHEVGTKTPNKWGIFDMLGNVWEWTCSHYNGGASLVFRGGGWYFDGQYCRPAERFYYAPAGCCDILGFRCALVRQLSK